LHMGSKTCAEPDHAACLLQRTRGGATEEDEDEEGGE